MVTHIIPIAFHSKHIYQPIKKYGAEKIIFIISEAKSRKAKEDISDAIDQAKKICEMMDVEFEEVHLDFDYNIEKRMKEFSRIIKNEKEVVINLTGGPRFDCIILYIAAMKQLEKILDIIIIREDIGEMISLPREPFTICLSKFEKQLIDEIRKKQKITIKELVKKLNKSPSQIHRYVKKLAQKNLIKIYKEEKERIVEMI